MSKYRFPYNNVTKQVKKLGEKDKEISSDMKCVFAQTTVYLGRNIHSVVMRMKGVKNSTSNVIGFAEEAQIKTYCRWR